ncbi:protocadherin gamma-A1-like isoform X2 [Gigantopelta aegis]|uniref:protocadherin gamma-A1-like isoform X2 n=1 Tax=Gigantopelta aegis TaxID=1735272 RepID=UPI001B88A442|nr:protocadherin gamma-A1-like isoform X2 [Gigantopelta aegis]
MFHNIMEVLRVMLTVVVVTRAGTVIGQIMATDQDGARNLTFDTADNDTATLIRIVNVRKSGKQITADLALKTLVDRDFAPSNRHIHISVTDGQYKAISRYVLVITDMNDNAPMFTQHEYKVTVLHSLPMHSVVLIVIATDPDATFGGRVSYSIQTDDLFAYQAFRVNQYTGMITLHSPLLTHRHTLLHFNVIATDGGGLSSSAKVIIHVQ